MNNRPQLTRIGAPCPAPPNPSLTLGLVLWPKVPTEGKRVGDPATYLFPDSVAQTLSPKAGQGQAQARSPAAAFPPSLGGRHLLPEHR